MDTSIFREGKLASILFYLLSLNILFPFIFYLIGLLRELTKLEGSFLKGI